MQNSLKSQLRNISDCEYFIIDKILEAHEGIEYIGHVSTRDFKNSWLFRLRDNDLVEVAKILKPRVKNFKLIKDNIIDISNIDSVQGHTLSQCNTIDKVNYEEKCLFHLLRNLVDEGACIEVENSVVGLDMLHFSKNKCSLGVKYFNTKGEVRTKRLMWFTDVPHINDFKIISKKDLSDVLGEYLEDGSLTEVTTGSLYAYQVNSSKINCNPVNQNKLWFTCNKQLLLTVIAELDMYNSYIEGLECGLSVIRKVLEIETEENWGSSKTVKGKSVNFNLSRKSFNRVVYKDMIMQNSDLLKNYATGKVETSEFVRVLKMRLQENFVGSNGDLALEGILYSLEHLNKGYAEASKFVNAKKKACKLEALPLNIYYYYWRVLFTDYTYLLEEFGFMSSPLDIKITGGAYDLSVNLSY